MAVDSTRIIPINIQAPGSDPARGYNFVATFPSYTQATLPTAAAFGVGYATVTDAASVLQYSDGATWSDVGGGAPTIPDYTWATLPSAATFGTGYATVTDLNGALVYSNGVKWLFPNVIDVFQGAVPLILSRSGTIGNNGALSALPSITDPPASCYMYFPANAIAAGVAAGWYYVVLSSATAGTIYNNTHTSGVPTIPTSPTAFVTTGPGAFTQVVDAIITAISFVLLGGLLGKNGAMRILAAFRCSAAGSKYYWVSWGATDLIYRTLASISRLELQRYFQNRGAQNVNWLPDPNSTGQSSSGSSAPNAAIDTSADVTISIKMALGGATGTDYIILDQYVFEAMPA